jgi:hypothetical protein
MENEAKPQKRTRKPKTIKAEEVKPEPESKPESKPESETDLVTNDNVIIEDIIPEPEEAVEVVEEVEETEEEVEETEEVEVEEPKMEEISGLIIHASIEALTGEKEEKEPMLEIKSLLNLLIITSVRTEMQDKYGLTQDFVKILQSIIQVNPNFFFKIESSFKKIVEDNKIDSDDVPELMSLFASMYELIFSLKLKKDDLEMSNVCGELIKLIFNIMLAENLIQFDSLVKEETAKTFNSLVDSSISLIKLSKTITLSNKCCFLWK